MRYSDGGGLTAEGRARRERVRLQAAQVLEQDIDPVQVAGLLRVSAKSVHQWRREYRAGGAAALAPKGPGGNACKLDDGQLSRLRAALDAGPAAYGWKEDQRWTLARITALIGRLFHVHYTLRGVLNCRAARQAVPLITVLSKVLRSGRDVPSMVATAPVTRASRRQFRAE